MLALLCCYIFMISVAFNKPKIEILFIAFIHGPYGPTRVVILKGLDMCVYAPQDYWKCSLTRNNSVCLYNEGKSDCLSDSSFVISSGMIPSKSNRDIFVILTQSWWSLSVCDILCLIPSCTLKCNTELPKMAANLWANHWYLIWPVRNLYACHVAYNSKLSILRQKYLSLFPLLFPEPLTHQPLDGCVM